MAAAETMTVTRDIDDTVKDVDNRLGSVDDRVKNIDKRVKDADDRVKGIVDSVIRGGLFFPLLAPEFVLSLYSVRCK
jgi:hypothetical protein